MTRYNADPRPYAQFILTRLLKNLPEGYGVRRAVAETEIPIEKDEWYWADDNAKVLGLLTLPEIWRENTDAVSDIVRFILSMCDGPLIFRRIGVPRFEILRQEGGSGQFRHSLMNIDCDLAKGRVSFGMRFHDGRTAKNATFLCPYVEFIYGGRKHTINLRDHTFRPNIEIVPEGVRFHWSAPIEIIHGWWRPRTVHIGDLSVLCTVRADSMFVDMEAKFEIGPRIEISDVTIALGLDDLGHNDNQIRYEMVSAAFRDLPPVLIKTKRFLQREIEMANGTYWAVWQNSHMLGFAAAVHALPYAPEHLVRLRIVADTSGRLHQAFSEHEFAGPQSGTLTAGEHRILTSGGLYRSTSLYADMLTRHLHQSKTHGMPVDLSISYDYGAEIHALALCLKAIAGSDRPERFAALRKDAETALNSLLTAYDEQFIAPAKTGVPAVFSRSLAFVALARAEMYETTRDSTNLTGLREACDLIATFERQNRRPDGVLQSGFLMGKETDSAPYVDCHAACLIALVKATDLLNDPQWIDSIDRGLQAFRIDKQTIGFCGHNHEFDLLCIDIFDNGSHRTLLDTFWNFKAGLSISLFNAMRAARHPGIKAAWAKHANRIAPLEALSREQIAKSTRVLDDALEIKCSVLSTETNSETQPWVALSLIGVQ